MLTVGERATFASKMKALVNGTGVTATEIAQRIVTNASGESDSPAKLVKNWQNKLSDWQHGKTPQAPEDLATAATVMLQMRPQPPTKAQLAQILMDLESLRRRARREPIPADEKRAPTQLRSPTDQSLEDFENEMRRALDDGRLHRCRELAAPYLTAAERRSDHRAVARISTVVGQALRRLGGLSESEQFLQRAVSAAEECAEGREVELAFALNHLGLTERSLGHLEQAERNLTLAMNATVRGGDHDLWARVFTSLALCTRDRGDLPRARDQLGEALDAQPSRTTPLTRAGALVALSIVELDAGADAPAAELLEEALGIYDRESHTHGRAIALGQLSRLHVHQGDPAEALKAAQECLDINSRQQVQEGILVGYVRIAQAELARERTQPARTSLMMAEALSRSMHFDYWNIIVNAELAVVLAKEGSTRRAWDRLTAARELARTSESTRTRGSVERRAEAVASLGSLSSAITPQPQPSE